VAVDVLVREEPRRAVRGGRPRVEDLVGVEELISGPVEAQEGAEQDEPQCDPVDAARAAREMSPQRNLSSFPPEVPASAAAV